MSSHQSAAPDPRAIMSFMSTKEYRPPQAPKSTRQMTPAERRAHAERRMAEIRALASDIGAVLKTDKSGPQLIAEQRR